MTRRAWCVLVLAQVLVVAASGVGGAEAADPLSGDDRLSAAVAVQKAAISVGELAKSLTTQSGVELSVSESLAPARLMVFVEGRSLGSVMAAVSEVVEGSWTQEESTPPSYRLCGKAEGRAAVDQSLREHWRDLERATEAPRRQKRAQRLEACRGALALTAEQLLAQYEQTDPWLCVALLTRVTRAMLEYACWLDPAEQERLLATGSFAEPMIGLAPELRQHLALWAKCTWGPPSAAQPLTDPDGPWRFCTPEQRWGNSVVRLRWGQECLEFYLDLPDVASFSGELARMAEEAPGPARERLADLGGGALTREEQSKLERETAEWEARRGKKEGEEELLYTSLVGACDTTDPRLNIVVNPAREPGEAVELAGVLREGARQGGFAVVAHALSEGMTRLRRSDGADPSIALLAALEEVRQRRRGLWWWRFREGYLLASDGSYRFMVAGQLSETVEGRWREMLRPGNTVGLEEVASAAAELNMPQVNTLFRTFAVLEQIPVDCLRLYGLLEAGQRAALFQAGGVRVGELGVEQQRALLQFGQQMRPWLEQEDLAEAVLRAEGRSLSTGELGFSFIVEYHLATLPEDRDIIFTAPVTISIPEVAVR